MNQKQRIENILKFKKFCFECNNFIQFEVMSVNQVNSYSRAQYPKSLMKIIKFYRFFDFSFTGETVREIYNKAQQTY